jgi:signal transduction histidine kinase
VQAQIVGSNSVSALVFNDPQSATNTLSALRYSPHIASAGIFTLDRHPFARYVRTPGDEIVNIPILPAGQNETSSFRGSHLVVVRSIVLEGAPVGFVYIRSDLTEIDDALKRYAAIALVVLLLSLMAALLISSVFRRSVAQPIVRLAAVAHAVSQEKDYSVRAEPSQEQDEIALLVNAFNEMLSQIQLRDDELRQAHAELEKRVEERTRELVAINRELEAFSYSVSHDLRGPVDAINGFTYVMLREYAGALDPRARELVERIRNSGRRMMQLIDDLLNLSRVASSTLQREDVDLSAIARSITEDIRRSQPDRDVEFVIDEVGAVNGDPRLIRLMLENLLQNAWKYTSSHPKARIEFGARQDGTNRVYFVRDDGSGFDSRSVHRLFQAFQRLHSVEEFPGNGIGLATVQRIIRRHGGEVWAEGEVDKGATFFFHFGKPKTTP